MRSRETDLAWAAGIIDGEGSIHLVHITRPAASGTRIGWRLNVTVWNTNPLIVQRTAEIFGVGSVHVVQRRPGWKPQWYWQTASKKAEEVLRAVEPYLVGKAEHARLALLSRSLMSDRWSRRVANPNAEQLEWLRAQLATLNQRGPVQKETA